MNLLLPDNYYCSLLKLKSVFLHLHLKVYFYKIHLSMVSALPNTKIPNFP